MPCGNHDRWTNPIRNKESLGRNLVVAKRHGGGGGQIDEKIRSESVPKRAAPQKRAKGGEYLRPPGEGK